MLLRSVWWQNAYMTFAKTNRAGLRVTGYGVMGLLTCSARYGTLAEQSTLSRLNNRDNLPANTFYKITIFNPGLGFFVLVWLFLSFLFACLFVLIWYYLNQIEIIFFIAETWLVSESRDIYSSCLEKLLNCKEDSRESFPMWQYYETSYTQITPCTSCSSEAQNRMYG